MPKQILDHVEGMLHLGSNLSFGFLELSHQIFARPFFHFLELAAFFCHVPSDVLILKLVTLCHTGVTRVSKHIAFFTMQQALGLGDIRYCGIRIKLVTR